MPSLIALVAILKAVDDIQNVSFSQRQKQKIKKRFKRIVNIKGERSIGMCRNKLDILYQCSQRGAASSDKMKSVPYSPSPTSVVSTPVGTFFSDNDMKSSVRKVVSKKAENGDETYHQVSKAPASRARKDTCNRPFISSRNKKVSKRKRRRNVSTTW